MSNQEGISLDQTVDPGIDEKLTTGSLLQKLEGLDECSRFLAFIRSADLGYVLERSNFQTLFAPVNGALQTAQLDGEDQEAILSEYLARGAIKTYDLRASGTLKDLAGHALPVRVTPEGMRVGDALITRPDVTCTNGVLHVIDRVFSTQTGR
jgi:uncharacterized surface protein with fasciclin (FAS1) repeats